MGTRNFTNTPPYAELEGTVMKSTPSSVKADTKRGPARAAGSQEITSELAWLCREAIKEDLKERRAEVLGEAAEAGKSTRYTCRDFASRKTKMTALRNPKGTTIASRKGMETIIYHFYSHLFDSHVHLPSHDLREDGHVIPEVLPCEVRRAIMLVGNLTASNPDGVRPEHLKDLPPVLINTLARLLTRYLSECKVPKQWKTSKTVLLYKKEIHTTLATIGDLLIFGTEAPSERSVRAWFQRFKAGNKKLEDEPRSGIVRRIDSNLSISFDELKNLAEQHPYEVVPTCIERRQPPKTPEIHEVWWGVHGIYRFELLPDNTTVTVEVYCAQVQRLADKIRKEHPKLDNVRLLHDNARPRVAKKTFQKILELR
ncbi:hypothetical protein RB195_023331 [Necator americanus]|uniref:Mos1 transposase HTH domain-containing protein n=1 Tax=Necator americanus TaxID=51031 RepID=A0ABR1EIW5_NECAM